MVIYLLNHKADIDEIFNNKNINYDTKWFGLRNIFYKIVYAKKVEIVKFLLKCNINKKIRDT